MDAKLVGCVSPIQFVFFGLVDFFFLSFIGAWILLLFFAFRERNRTYVRTWTRRLSPMKFTAMLAAETLLVHSVVGEITSTTTPLCDNAPCPVPCEGAWTPWCSCSSSCGANGIQGRIFLETQEALYDGEPCTHAHGDVDEKSCNTDVACPVDCYGAWSDWSDCSMSCGSGASTRTFAVSRPAENGGATCTDLFGAEDTATEQVPCFSPCDHDDDYGDDDDDVDRGHGFYLFAPFVDTRVPDGVFGIFGHYSNVSRVVLQTSQTLLLQELI